MPGYLRDKTRPQGDRPIRFNQNNFGGGINIDIPGTDINNNQVIQGENYIWFERYADGRGGSVEVDSLPGSGTLNANPLYHQETKTLIIHRGTQLFRQNGALATEIKDYASVPASFGIDEKTTIKEFGKNAIIFTSQGIFFILIEESNYAKFFKLNGDRPKDVELGTAIGSEATFKYKYVYTFSTIINTADGELATSGDRNTTGNKIIHETPPVLPGEAPTDPITGIKLPFFRIRSINTEIDSVQSLQVKVGAAETSFPIEISHVTFYRTPDIGQEGRKDKGFFQFSRVGDTPIDTGTPTNTQLLDGTSDEELDLKNPDATLPNTGWTALPDGQVGEVTENFVFVAGDNDEKLNYSQRIPNDTVIGFHNVSLQFHEFDDGIKILAATADILTTIQNRHTHISALTSTIDTFIFESNITLTHFAETDSQIGVRDTGSFAKIGLNSYIAKCSDGSVRIWDGAGWSRDLTIDTIATDIAKAVEGISVGIYYNGAYFLWYTKDDNKTVPDICARLSVKRETGKGWTFFTGADWIFPPSQRGAFIGDNFLTANGIGLDFLFVVDEVDNKIFWIETFNGPDNKTINTFAIRKFFADKVSSGSPNGTNIVCRVRHKELTGSQESFNIIHQESHAYMRDLADTTKVSDAPATTIPALSVDARAFVDGKLIKIETAGKVTPGDDIRFWYRVEGSRISIEFEANRSAHQLTKIDGRFRVQDILRPNQGPSETIAATFQRDFQQNLKQWVFTRPRPFLNRATQEKFSANRSIIQNGPDNRSAAVRLNFQGAFTNPYISASTTVYMNAFTTSFFVKDPSFGIGSMIIFKINGAGGNPDFIIEFTSTTNLRITKTGATNVTVSDIGGTTNTINGYHHFVLVRASGSSIMNVYQNDVLVDSPTISGTFGGGDVEYGSVS